MSYYGSELGWRSLVVPAGGTAADGVLLKEEPVRALLDPDAYWPVCGMVLAMRLGRLGEVDQIRRLLKEFGCPRIGHLWNCDFYMALRVERTLS